MKTVLIVIAIFIGLVALDFGGEYYDLWKFGIFAPKQERISTEVFKNSPAYIGAFNRSLSADYQNYMEAPDSDKAVMANIIKVKYSQYKTEDVDEEVIKNWLIKIRGY